MDSFLNSLSPSIEPPPNLMSRATERKEHFFFLNANWGNRELIFSLDFNNNSLNRFNFILTLIYLNRNASKFYKYRHTTIFIAFCILSRCADYIESVIYYHILEYWKITCCYCCDTVYTVYQMTGFMGQSKYILLIFFQRNCSCT